MSSAEFKTNFSYVRPVEYPSCLQKPMTKAALFVISLLFAGGAVASHFTGLGMPGIVAFSVASGGTLATFMITCVCCAAINVKREEPKTGKSSQPVETKPKIKTENELIEEFQNSLILLSDEELLRKMTVVDQQRALIENGSESETASEIIENKVIAGILSSRIQHQIKTHYSEGAQAVAQTLQPLFNNAAGISQDTFKELVQLTIFNSGYVPLFTAEVLEKVEWPDYTPEEKQEELVKYLTGKLYAHDLISVQEGYINLEGTSDSGFRTYNLVVVTKKIFGTDDFINDPKSVPDSLARAIGNFVSLVAKGMIDDLEKDSLEGPLKDPKLGVKVGFEQYMECRFPASMIAPVLPYLKNIPGLVGLEMKDIGTNSFDALSVATGGHGFGDEHVEALLDVIRTNPHLIQVGLSFNGMTPQKQQEFMEEWQKILETRGIPTLEGYLPLPTSEEK